MKNVIEIDCNSRIDHQGDALVIPILKVHEISEICLKYALEYTPDSVAIALFIDDNAKNIPYDYLQKILKKCASNRKVYKLTQKSKVGYTQQCKIAFEVFFKSNVIVMNDDVVVGVRWYEELLKCKLKYSEAATLSFWSNNGGYLSLDIGDQFASIDRGRNFNKYDNICKTVEEVNLILKNFELNKVIVPVAVGHLIWINRIAINTVGTFDYNNENGYGFENAFSYEASKFGFINVVVPSFVYHGKSLSSVNLNNELELISDIVIGAKYDWHNDIVHEFMHNKFSRLKSIIKYVEAKSKGISIGIDATMFDGLSSGTNNCFLSLSKELTKSARVLKVTWIINASTEDSTANNIEKIKFLAKKSGISILNLQDPGSLDKIISLDFVFRTSQTFITEDWLRISSKAYMSGVWMLDFIAFGSPFYSTNKSHWFEQRQNIIHGLKFTDALFYLTEHVQEVSKAYNTIFESFKNYILPIGIDLSKEVSNSELSEHIVSEDLLCYGASFNHKNRVYLLRVAQKLITIGWRGKIKFVGPRPLVNDSHEDEKRLTESDIELRQRYFDCGYLDDQKLIQEILGTNLVIYPSISEGFGMVPWESLKYNKLTVTSNLSALNETTPPFAPTLSLRNVDEDAELILQLLRQPMLRDSSIQMWRDRALGYQWNNIIERFIDDIFELLSEGPSKVYQDNINLELPRIENILSTIKMRQFLLVKIRNIFPQNLDSRDNIRLASKKSNYMSKILWRTFSFLKRTYRSLI